MPPYGSYGQPYYPAYPAFPSGSYGQPYGPKAGYMYQPKVNSISSRSVSHSLRSNSSSKALDAVHIHQEAGHISSNNTPQRPQQQMLLLPVPLNRHQEVPLATTQQPTLSSTNSCCRPPRPAPLCLTPQASAKTWLVSVDTKDTPHLVKAWAHWDHKVASPRSLVLNKGNNKDSSNASSTLIVRATDLGAKLLVCS